MVLRSAAVPTRAKFMLSRLREACLQACQCAAGYVPNWRGGAVGKDSEEDLEVICPPSPGLSGSSSEILRELDTLIGSISKHGWKLLN